MEYKIKDEEDYLDYVNEEELAYDFISPMSDFGFKNFFASGENSKENLLVLLNAILHEQLNFERITDLRLNPTEDKAESPGRKTTFYDIHCTTSSGKKLIVEMQNKYEDNFRDRMLFYGMEAMMQQDHRAKNKRRIWNYDLVPVVTIALCDFHLPGFSNKPIACFNLRDIYTNVVYGNQLQLVFIHMTEFTDDPSKCKSELEKIVYSLKNMATIQKMKNIPFSTQEGDFYYRLALKSRVSALSPEEREDYDRWLKHEYDRFLREQKLMTEAKSKGLAEGRAEGRVEEKWEIARNLHKLGIDLDTISKASGLSKTDLREKL